MSYNVDNILMTDHFELEISNADLVRLREELEDNLPEDSFIEAGSQWVYQEDGQADTWKIHRLQWAGSWSGRTWGTFLNTVLPCVRGDASFMVVWEAGDRIEKYWLHDGVAKRVEVFG